MSDDLKKLAEAAKAARDRCPIAGYFKDDADADAARLFDEAATPDAFLALIRERDEALLWQGRVDNELSAVATAIGTVEFMDPPDGGDVSLAEQVSRMRVALSAAREEVERYKIALADATRRPMGVLPASAEGLITTADMEAAEARRTRHGADPRDLNPDTLRYGNKRFKRKEPHHG